MSENKEYTTMAVDKKSATFIETMAKGAKISKKEFIKISMDYFMENGINPIEHETPKAEIAKLTKRLNQFFAFFKKQETTIILPMANTIINENTAIKKQDKELKEKLQEQLNDMGTLIKEQKEHFDRMKQTYDAIEEMCKANKQYLEDIEEANKKVQDGGNNKKSGWFAK